MSTLKHSQKHLRPIEEEKRSVSFKIIVTKFSKIHSSFPILPVFSNFYLNVNHNFAHYGSKYPCICDIPNNWGWRTKQHHKHVCHSQINNENVCYRLHRFCCCNCYKNLKRKYINDYRIKSIVCLLWIFSYVW